MSNNETLKPHESKISPPYVPFKTLDTFIASLKATIIPTRIDRSVMGSMSGAMQSQLASALRYLGLITPANLPTDVLGQLVHSEGAERKKRMKSLLITSYPFLFNNPKVDLSRATQREFEQAFTDVVPSLETAKKCMSFFIAAAKDAEVQLSPFIKKRPGSPKGARPRRIPSTPNGASHPPAPPKNEPQGASSWAEMLLAKFPTFDPQWPDEVKAKWFTAFDQLMKHGQEKGTKS